MNKKISSNAKVLITKGKRKPSVCSNESGYFNRLWWCKWMVIGADSPDPLLEIKGICWSSQFSPDLALLC